MEKHIFSTNVPLSSHSYYKIGGEAKYFFEARNIDEIVSALAVWREIGDLESRGIFIMGAGTNILFKDEGFDGLILKPEIKFIEKEDGFLKVGAGVLMSELLEYAIENNLSGLEWAGGLPGTLGGAVYGNAGAFGGEMKNVVCDVVSVGISGLFPTIIRRSREDCGFGYRSSVFKENKNEIIVEAMLKLTKWNQQAIRRETEDKIKYRLDKHPMEYPSLGSTFRNIEIAFLNDDKINLMISEGAPIIEERIPAAYLISQAGLKGVSCGGAVISPKHPNFIVNALNATSADVRNLIELIKAEVGNRFGVNLDEEIVIHS
ncbi:UDP-N-acetylmuramate dehydrogenase [Candidatus Wolfebacteria bacterium]|nr:UDP-N-acetylmuramate dehydrogenase [Candidatus Wolfebacteria bacterium]